MNRWTSKEIKLLEEELKKKLTFGQIAILLKRSRASVAGQIRRIKIKTAGQLDFFK